MGNSQPSRRIGVEELYAQDGGAGGSGGGELPYPMPHHHMAAPTAGSSMAAADPTTLSSLPDLSSLVKIFVVDCPPRYDLPWQMEDQLQCTGTGKSRVVQSFTSAHHQPPPATISHHQPPPATTSHHQPRHQQPSPATDNHQLSYHLSASMPCAILTSPPPHQVL